MRQVVRAKLISWLVSRGVNLGPGLGSPASVLASPAGAGSSLEGGANGAGVATTSTDESDTWTPASWQRGSVVSGGSSKRRRTQQSRERSGGGRVRLTPEHLFLAYVLYLNKRDQARAAGGGEEEESEYFCFKCKDGGEVILCDYNGGGCYKSYHLSCCKLKSVPSGTWECPRHRCKSCGARADGGGRRGANGRCGGDEATELWPCRTCPTTYCTKCLPEGLTRTESEIICEARRDVAEIACEARP